MITHGFIWVHLGIFALHPQRATIATGGNITFSIPAIGVGYTYHWKKKNGSLPNTAAIGQNTPHLNILSVNPVDSGIYHCIVEFPSGYKVKSARATLTVYGESLRKKMRSISPNL